VTDGEGGEELAGGEGGKRRYDSDGFLLLESKNSGGNRIKGPYTRKVVQVREKSLGETLIGQWGPVLGGNRI